MIKQNKKMTYEDIARIYDITPAKAHSIAKTAYNKMVKGFIENHGINIFDTVLIIRAYFNMDEQEAYDKLNDEYKVALKEYAQKEFEINKNDDTL